MRFAEKAHNRLESARKALERKGAARFFRLVEGKTIFKPHPPGIEPIRHPSGYPEIAKYNLEVAPLETEDLVPISVWEKMAQPGKPHFLLFHGNSYHWGHVMTRDKDVLPNARLGFLDQVLKTGAGVTAVNLRGFGDSGGTPSEEGFKCDIKAVVDHMLKDKKIPSRSIIVAGDSMGTATATMAAVEMTGRNQPPAILGMVNPFFDMPLEVTEVLPRDKRAAHLHALPDYNQIWAVMKNSFDTKVRVHELSRSTHMFIATSKHDNYVQPYHSELLVDEMEPKGYVVQHVLFPDGRHSHWPHEAFVKEILKHYQLMNPPAREEPCHVEKIETARCDESSPLMAK